MTFSTGAGDGRYYWRPQGIAPGIYFLKLRTADGESATRVMLLD